MKLEQKIFSSFNKFNPNFKKNVRILNKGYANFKIGVQI